MLTSSGTDVALIFDRLKAVLEPHGRRMHVTGDSPAEYVSTWRPKATATRRPGAGRSRR